MKQNDDSNRIQFQLSHLIAAPLLVAPFFLGISFRDQMADPEAGSIGHVALVLLFYVLFCCWLAIRHLSPSNDFRRFPFRGSLLIGGLAGIAFTAQALLGLAVGLLVSDFAEVMLRMTPTAIVLSVLDGIMFSILYGGFVGCFFGLISGGLYCALRFVGHSHSQATPISKKAWRKRRRDGTPIDLGNE